MKLGEHRVERSDYGWWVYPRGGQRAKFYPHGSVTARRIDSGIALDNLERTRRAHATGTHEPISAWRNPDGTIGIPADPSFAPPADSEPFQITTLAQADAIAREIEAQTYAQWHGDEAFTSAMDERLGHPREALNTRLLQTSSQFEKEVIREFLKELDTKESQRRDIRVHAGFHYRDYDR